MISPSHFLKWNHISPFDCKITTSNFYFYLTCLFSLCIYSTKDFLCLGNMKVFSYTWREANTETSFFFFIFFPPSPSQNYILEIIHWLAESKTDIQIPTFDTSTIKVKTLFSYQLINNPPPPRYNWILDTFDRVGKFQTVKRNDSNGDWLLGKMRH